MKATKFLLVFVMYICSVSLLFHLFMYLCFIEIYKNVNKCAQQNKKMVIRKNALNNIKVFSYKHLMIFVHICPFSYLYIQIIYSLLVLKKWKVKSGASSLFHLWNTNNFWTKVLDKSRRIFYQILLVLLREIRHYSIQIKNLEITNNTI